MTRKIPHLGNSDTRDASIASTHECQHCGQQLPQHMLNQNATQSIQPEQLEHLEPLPIPDDGIHKSGTIDDDIPDPEVAVPESSTAREAPAATSSKTESKTESHELPASPSHGPEMWLADCLSAIEHKVGDFITHFDHTLAEPKSKAPAHDNSTSRSVPANPPSYDSATFSEKTPLSQQGNGPARNACAQMKGHYHCSSHSMMLKDGHILSAQCADPNGKHLASTIDLNDCLTNDNGVLKWKAYGNFKASARNARLCDDGKCLELEIKNHKGQWRFDKFDLSERIENRNGKLVFLRPWMA